MAGDDGGSILWTLLKWLAVVVGVYLLFGLALSLVKYVVVLALVGGAGYAGYRLLTGGKSKGLETAEPLLLEADSDDEFEREMRRLEAEDRRLSAEIDRLSGD